MCERKPTGCKYVTKKVRNTQISESRWPGRNHRDARLEHDCDPVNGNLLSCVWTNEGLSSSLLQPNNTSVHAKSPNVFKGVNSGSSRQESSHHCRCGEQLCSHLHNLTFQLPPNSLWFQTFQITSCFPWHPDTSSWSIFFFYIIIHDQEYWLPSLREGMREPFRVWEMFYVLFWVLITQVFTRLNISQALHLRFVHFM